MSCPFSRGQRTCCAERFAALWWQKKHTSWLGFIVGVQTVLHVYLSAEWLTWVSSFKHLGKRVKKSNFCHYKWEISFIVTCFSHAVELSYYKGLLGPLPYTLTGGSLWLNSHIEKDSNSYSHSHIVNLDSTVSIMHNSHRQSEHTEGLGEEWLCFKKLGMEVSPETCRLGSKASI